MYLKPVDPENYWVLDIEADSLTPTQIWCVCVRNIKTEEEKTFLEAEEFNQWIRPENKYIGHNAISFDIPTINKLWGSNIPLGSVVDTLVLSYLFNPALEEGHSLGAWGVRMKSPKIDFSDWTKYSDEMLKYCQQDVRLNHKVYTALTSKMHSMGYSEMSCSIEHRIRVVIDEQQNTGFWFDEVRARNFLRDLRKLQRDLSQQIQELFPAKRTLIKEREFRRTKEGRPHAQFGKDVERFPEVTISDDGSTYYCFDYVPFNLGSPIQRVDRLLELGWEPEAFTKTKSEKYPEGFPKVDEDALIKFAEKSGERTVAALAEWLVLQGRSSMIETWLNNLGPDSRIHGKIFTCGATTRRMTHNSPNTANIPSGAKAKYGHECRSFWGVEPNRSLVLVGYDASGLETAGLCHYLNNPTATEILLRPKPDDIHTANARRLTEALGREVDREWGAKTSWYAWLYGAYPPKLGSIVRGPASDGEIVIETFFRNVPGLKELIEGIKHEFRSNRGRLRTIDGGFVLCQSENAALNYKIQSAGAIVMKLTSILLDEEAKKLGLRFKKVGDIHDEGQLECHTEDASVLGMLAVDCITRAGRELGFSVPLTGDYKIGTNWSETH